jgi:hypothetical protein
MSKTNIAELAIRETPGTVTGSKPPAKRTGTDFFARDQWPMVGFVRYHNTFDNRSK